MAKVDNPTRQLEIGVGETEVTRGLTETKTEAKYRKMSAPRTSFS